MLYERKYFINEKHYYLRHLLILIPVRNIMYNILQSHPKIRKYSPNTLFFMYKNAFRMGFKERISI